MRLDFIFITILFLFVPVMAQEHTANYWLQKGDEFYNNSSYDLALKCNDKAIEINPKEAYAWQNKGNILKKFNRTAEANEAFATAADLSASTIYETIPDSKPDLPNEVDSSLQEDRSLSEIDDYNLREGTFVLLDLKDDLILYELGYSEADPGKQYILVKIKAENHGYHEFDLEPYCIKMIVNKIVYDRVHLSLSDNGYPPLEDVTLQDEGEISGYIAFSVPDGTENYSLRYDQWSWDNYNIVWNKWKN